MSNLSAIYVRLPNWIGDVCMSLPSLHALLATQLPIVVCAKPWAKDLLAAYKLGGFIEMRGHWREDRASVTTFRKKSQHAHPRGLLLPDSLSSAMVFKFSGIPSAGYRDDGRSLILRWPINKPPANLHAVESWHYITSQALKRWNHSVSPAHPAPRLGLRLADKHHKDALHALKNAGLEPGEFVLIAPTATGLHHGRIKVWPHFDALTRKLQERGYTVAMCPPASEADAARRNAPTALCLPPLNLGAFATLTRLASLVVCNDSGVSHLAAAADARQLTLFGVTQPERTGPWSKKATCLGSAHTWPSLEETEQQVLTLLR
ncbi:heptosyltransferase [Candidimonas sp. SYP-B2681]|uniref:glycosyltransferase family 9 protein n=1 Tax=Candidimonas sp. SYP-B2681 TaxID=2497686 RepID=UPI000F86602C|nr:glycosyltransferase family 9 protein [Candidimonas sp. SYP-B2681]RTZ44389.1 heptosyltransferase [Candidimonas sp. SYP-B2681]